MVKEKKVTSHKENPKNSLSGVIAIILYASFFSGILAITLVLSGFYYFENTYQNKVYPGIKIDGVDFGGKTSLEVEQYFQKKNLPFDALNFTLVYQDQIATISASEMSISFDGKLSSAQAYSLGRSKNILSDLYQKWKAITVGIYLQSVLNINTTPVEDLLTILAQNIDIPAEDALFQFENNKVNSFKPGKNGRKLDQIKTKKTILDHIHTLAYKNAAENQNIIIDMPVEIIVPKTTTENSNNYGIRELLGTGSSKYAGSIPGRIHNVDLASSKIHGHLVAPGSDFSFNDTLGDVSANTGFQPAYIIKDGRTVLGDGGGVCQVSTTLFRALLSAGLPVTERHAHSYRVSYYEQGSSPGIDATVFAPSYDLKFVNDTGNYILIQAKSDPSNYSLIFEIYGTNDGRKAEITKPVILSQSSAPEDFFQDDPTLQKGVVKQVDWKASGAKVKFDWSVSKNGEKIYEKTFYSNYQPWRAVFLRGTKE